jgi:2,3-bisphosphoglycerate-independent phosphoglycerate mutase
MSNLYKHGDDKVIFIFIDGVGIGRNHPDNPFALTHFSFLENLIGGPLLEDYYTSRKDLVFKGIDACLGVDGYPQSATGQTALFTGINAPACLGYHYPAYPNEPLITIINKHSFLKKAADAGFSATFANAYTPQYFELVKKERYQYSASTLTAMAAGLPFRMIDDLLKGKAVYWDITNKWLKEERGFHVPIIQPEDAGKNLAGIAHSLDLVLYETFATDMIGHKKDREKAKEFLTVFDRFLAGFFAHKTENMTLVISSDHGNIEDLSHCVHTRNQAVLLAAGPRAFMFDKANDLTDISGIILEILEQGRGG